MNLSLIYGTIIGILIGLAYCYWNQAKAAYENRGALGAASGLYDNAKTLYEEFSHKL